MSNQPENPDPKKPTTVKMPRTLREKIAAEAERRKSTPHAIALAALAVGVDVLAKEEAA